MRCEILKKTLSSSSLKLVTATASWEAYLLKLRNGKDVDVVCMSKTRFLLRIVGLATKMKASWAIG